MIVEVRYLDALPPWKSNVYAFEAPVGTKVGEQFVDYANSHLPIVEVVGLGSTYAGPLRLLTHREGKEQVMAPVTPERELERIDRFRRIAGGRANRALEQIERLMTTADRSRYSFTDKQVIEIVSKLRQAVDQLEVAYAEKHRIRVEL